MISDEDVAIGKNLRVMLMFQIILSDYAHNFALRIYFNQTIEVSRADQGVAISHPRSLSE